MGNWRKDAHICCKCPKRKFWWVQIPPRTFFSLTKYHRSVGRIRTYGPGAPGKYSPTTFHRIHQKEEGLIPLRLSLNRIRKMDGERVYVFSENMWAMISAKGPYPLLVLENRECRSWEDWPDVQSGGIYTRRPVLKSLLAKCAKAIR